jgi:hypothetical protein
MQHISFVNFIVNFEGVEMSGQKLLATVISMSSLVLQNSIGNLLAVSCTSPNQ